MLLFSANKFLLMPYLPNYLCPKKDAPPIFGRRKPVPRTTENEHSFPLPLRIQLKVRYTDKFRIRILLWNYNTNPPVLIFFKRNLRSYSFVTIFGLCNFFAGKKSRIKSAAFLCKNVSHSFTLRELCVFFANRAVFSKSYHL